jgi:hypothetical protein
MDNAPIDTRFYFEDIDGIVVRLHIIGRKNPVSLRDIIKFFTKFLNAIVDRRYSKQATV